MTAPIFFEKEYELNVEIEQGVEDCYFLRIERIYNFDNVWEARNEYETFFERSDIYIEGYEPEPYYDKWINMIGNEECMIVKEVYIDKFESLKAAQSEKERLQKDYEEFKKRNQWELGEEETDLDSSDDWLLW